MLFRKYTSLIGILLLTACIVSDSFAQIQYNSTDWGVNAMDFSKVGTAGFQFLKLQTNARSAGMGGVLAATAYGDATSAFTNPASAADVKSSDIYFGNMKWVADIQCYQLSAVKNLSEWGNFGVNIDYVNYGEMARTEIQADDNGNSVPVITGLGTFSAHDLAAGILYSRQITTQLQIGGNLRYVEEQLDDAKTYTWSVDIGTLYWTGIGSWRISMLGKNFGPDGKFTSYRNRIARAPVNIRMPMMLVLGSAYDIIDSKNHDGDRLTVSAEYVNPSDGKEKVNLGAEYFLFHNIYFRGGYRFNYDEERFTFGFGIEYSIEDDIKIRIDYAYLDLNRFNHVNLLTAGLAF